MTEKTKLKPASTTSKLPANLATSSVHREFRLKNILSEDITGTIYNAELKFRGRPVAVNVLAPECNVVSEKLIKINHPNICRAYKIVKIKDGTAVVIERPLGKPILQFISDKRRGDFSVAQGVSVILQLLSALHAIHETGETARNLNINNIFLFRDLKSNLKLKLVSIGIEGKGINLKSPHYLSPERILDTDKGDRRSDIWAAGAVFYHLCFKKPPFGDGDAYDVAQKNLLETPNFDSTDQPIPEELIRIIKKALMRDESKRYQTVTAMVGDLLPLRERFNEPMSDDVSRALKKSYPPPPDKPSNKIVPKKPTPQKGGMVMGNSAKSTERKDNTVGFEKPRESISFERPRESISFERPKGNIKEPTKTDGLENTTKNPPQKNQPRKKGLFGAAAFATPKKVERQAAKPTNPSRTLMGIPAVSDADISKALHQPKKQSHKKKASRAAQKRSSSFSRQEDFFSPRSILGNEDEIKAFENEMDFLEAEDDGDVPTLVANQESFAKLVGEAMNVGSTSEKTSPPKPDESSKQEAPEAQPSGLAADKNEAKNDKTETDKATSSLFQPMPLPTQEVINEENIETARAPMKEVDAIAAEAQSSLSEKGAKDTPKKEDVAQAEIENPEPPLSKVEQAEPPRGKPDRRKWFIGAAAGGILMLLIIVFALFGNENKPAPGAPAESQSAAAPTQTAVLSQTAAITPTISKADIPKPPPPPKAELPAQNTLPQLDKAPTVDTAEDTAVKNSTDTPDTATKDTAEMVTVSLTNLPTGATIKVDGISMNAPLTAPSSKAPVILTIQAPGFKPFHTELTFDETKEIPVKMVKVPNEPTAKPTVKPAPKQTKKMVKKNKKKKKRNKKKKKKKRNKKKSKTLVSNPFKS